VLNETAVRELGLQSPVVGQWFVSPGITPPYLNTGVVIGVVRDFFYKTIHEPIDPVVIKNEPGYASTFLVKTAAGRHQDALYIVERTWKQLIHDIPFEYQFVSEEFDALYRADQKAASLILIFSILAIFISCLGLYALVTFNTEQRTKEIGIRKVMGAS
jgi:putative ABC transport system permease protein